MDVVTLSAKLHQFAFLGSAEPIKNAVQFLEDICVNDFSSILSDKHNMSVEVVNAVGARFQFI
jgi:hypothetical protein